MSKVNVITLTGVPGSGTTTIAKLLSFKLELRLVFIGETFRELASEYKMSLTEFGEHVKNNPKIDYELDTRQIEYARTGNIILEGRLSGWMAMKNNIDAFRILLTADLNTRINRIMGRENKSYEMVKQEIIAREASEVKRYKKLYGINYLEPSYYDLIIDTSDLSPEQIVDEIIKNIH